MLLYTQRTDQTQIKHTLMASLQLEKIKWENENILVIVFSK